MTFKSYILQRKCKINCSFFDHFYRWIHLKIFIPTFFAVLRGKHSHNNNREKYVYTVCQEMKSLKQKKYFFLVGNGLFYCKNYYFTGFQIAVTKIL